MTDKKTKVGRPKSNNPSDIRLGVRVTRELKKKIDLYCKNNNTTISEMVKKAIDNLLEQ